MPLQVWKQTASDKDKSAVAGEITIITIIGHALSELTNVLYLLALVILTLVLIG